MNTFLISAGAVIVAALLAAFVAPVFIDWNGFRDRIEVEASRMLCRQVDISGDLVVRLLPEPVLTTGQVEITGPDGEVLLSIAGSKLKLGLGDLLIGKIEVTALELDQPKFAISTGKSGVLNWAEATSQACAPELAGVNFRRISITDGVADFQDASMAAPVTLEQIDATLTAGGPEGPYKFTGAHGPAEDRRGFTISAGRITPGTPTRVSGRLALDDRTEISFDGLAQGWQAPPLFTGVLKASRTWPGPDDDTLQLRGEAQAEISLGMSNFTKVLLTATKNGETATAAGTVRILFGDRAPDILLDLKARRLDFDELFGSSGAEKNGLAALVAQAADWAETSGMTGRVSVRVDGAVYRGELMRDVSAVVNLGSENLGIEAFRAVLPGQSQLDFTGNLVPGAAGGKLLGTVVLSTADLNSLLAWAVPPARKRFSRMLPPTRGNISLTGGLRAEIDALELTGIDGLIDGKTFSGDVSFDLRRPGEIYAALAFDELELDRLLPEDFDPLALLTGKAVEVDTSAPVIGLEIEARRVKWRGREARGLSAAAGFSGGRLVVERFRLENFAGGRLDAEGEVRFDDSGPQGSVDVVFATEDFPALPAIFGVDIAARTGLGPDWLSNLRRGNLQGRLSSKNTGGAWQVGLTVDGVLGGTEISASLTSDAAPATVNQGRIDATLTLANANAGRLLAQLGIGGLPSSTPDDPGSLTVNGVGSMAKGFGYSGRLTAFAATAAAEGNIETEPARVRGRLTLSADNSNRIADLMGIGTLAPVLPGTDIAMDFDLKDGALDVAGIEGKIAGVDASGGGRWQIAGQRSGAINLELERLSVPWAMASLFGGGSEISAAALTGARALWSTALIDTSVLDRWPVRMKIGVGKLEVVRDLVLDNGTIDAKVGEGWLELTALQGDIAPGRRFKASGDMLISELSLGVEGKIKADGLVIGRYLADGEGRPLLEGQAGVDLTFKAAGRSLLSLVSSLRGEGTLTIRAGRIPRMDAKALLKKVKRAGNTAAVEAMVSGALGGATSISVQETEFTAENGRVTLAPAAIEAGPLTGQLRGVVNLVEGRIDQELTLTSGSSPQLSIVHAGRLGEVSRQIELTGLSTDAVRWREPSSGASASSPSNPQSAGQGPARPPQADVPNSDPSGPPVGVIEEKVFELPLAGGG